ncbi:hypothetical protein C8R44DRAFT_736218 [Mycena epipterygia]|nr:hypothetical protein C8R44DRAFT_736218 [Mycena epipterygia]
MYIQLHPIPQSRRNAWLRCVGRTTPRYSITHIQDPVELPQFWCILGPEFENLQRSSKGLHHSVSPSMNSTSTFDSNSSLAEPNLDASHPELSRPRYSNISHASKTLSSYRSSCASCVQVELGIRISASNLTRTVSLVSSFLARELDPVELPQFWCILGPEFENLQRPSKGLHPLSSLARVAGHSHADIVYSTPLIQIGVSLHPKLAQLVFSTLSTHLDAIPFASARFEIFLQLLQQAQRSARHHSKRVRTWSVELQQSNDPPFTQIFFLGLILSAISNLFPQGLTEVESFSAIGQVQYAEVLTPVFQLSRRDSLQLGGFELTFEFEAQLYWVSATIPSGAAITNTDYFLSPLHPQRVLFTQLGSTQPDATRPHPLPAVPQTELTEEQQTPANRLPHGA